MTQPTIEQEFDVKLLQELASCLQLEVPITWHWDKLRACGAINAAFERYHAALTAQAEDGNRLPLDEILDGVRRIDAAMSWLKTMRGNDGLVVRFAEDGDVVVRKLIVTIERAKDGAETAKRKHVEPQPERLTSDYYGD